MTNKQRAEFSKTLPANVVKLLDKLDELRGDDGALRLQLEENREKQIITLLAVRAAITSHIESGKTFRQEVQEAFD